MKSLKYISVIWVRLTISNLFASEIVHKFKSPSFSGIGTSSHYLTIENQEKSREEKIQEKLETELASQARADANTTAAKFKKNLESRIYAQISKQLVDNMFGIDADPDNALSGSFTLEGNTITYGVRVGEDGQDIIVVSITNPDGSITELEVPVGVGAF